MKYYLFILFFLAAISCLAQDSTGKPLTISGYTEIYYNYDFNTPSDHLRPAFLYSYNRSNEVNLNLAFVKAAYTINNVRANLSIGTGTYMNANLAAEPGVLKNIFEANAGLRLSNKKDLWLDAGILPSHIGFEAATGKDCWTLSRSILADNSPYYEAGARLSYTSPDTHWYFAALVLNGWQRIQRVSGNNSPSFGTQIVFKPVPAVTLNSSSFIGNDKPDTVRRMRYFHNFYGIFRLSQAISATVGFDAGWEQKTRAADAMNNWYSPILMLQFRASPKTALTVRGEYYSDKNGVIVNTGTPSGFQCWGFSANVDISVSSNAVWRFEVRSLSNRDAIFTKDDSRLTKSNTCISTAVAINF